MRDLRAQVLTLSARELRVTSTPALPQVFGLLMETGYPEAVASLVVFAEGSTSLYFSNGGGVIGAGDQESVRAQIQPFLSEAEAHLADFVPATETPHTGGGQGSFSMFVPTVER
jgi:hypothetical protein